MNEEDNIEDTPTEAPSTSQPTDAPETDPQMDAAPDAPQEDASPENQAPDEQRPDETEQQPSLTNSKPVAPTSQPEQIDPAAYKRLRDEASEFGRYRKQMAEQLEKTRSQMAELQKFREEQMQKVEQQKLDRWDYRHPEHNKFNNLLERASLIRQQISRVRAPDSITDPAHREAFEANAKDAILSAISPEEREELERYQTSLQTHQREFYTNPVGALSKHVVPMIRQEIQAMFQEQQQRAEVQRDLEDPALKPLIERFGPEIEKAMAAGTPYDQAIHYTKVYGAYESVAAENARLKQQLQSMGVKVKAADHQHQLDKGKAAITKDVSVRNTAADPYLQAKKWARENGVDTMSAAFHQKHREYEARLAAH